MIKTCLKKEHVKKMETLPIFVAFSNKMKRNQETFSLYSGTQSMSTETAKFLKSMKCNSISFSPVGHMRKNQQTFNLVEKKYHHQKGGGNLMYI